MNSFQTVIASLAMALSVSGQALIWNIGFTDGGSCDGNVQPDDGNENYITYNGNDYMSQCMQIGAPAENCQFNGDPNGCQFLNSSITTTSFNGNCYFFEDSSCQTEIGLVVPIDSNTGLIPDCLDANLPNVAAFYCTPICDDSLAPDGSC